jgi:hypothetical protein
LGAVKGIGNYESVVAQSVVASFSYGQYRFLSMDALITAKQAVGRDRDLDAVRRLLAIKEKRQQDLF